MKSIGRGTLEVEGTIGNVIDDCVDEVLAVATKLASSSLVDAVYLNFNDKRLVIMYDGKIKSVSEIYAQYYLGGKE